jgi:rifampicin phosphotransferase
MEELWRQQHKTDRKALFHQNLPLAVRSSATAEDLPGASFAGQQESYLNVRGKSGLLYAVQRCWLSLWTARALDYRSRQGIEPSTVSLAVVVQVMVPAEASGIMFTANPINGARDEIVLDAAWGLGEAIVGGLVTPDHVVIDKVTGMIKQITIADKMVMTQPTATETEERPVEESKRRAQVLEAVQATELAKLGAEIEKYYHGEPQDIEWCLAKYKFYIVQARPITTLPPEPMHWKSPIAGAKWLKDLQAAEWATEPLSPLGATTTFDFMMATRQHKLPMQRSPTYALINGWLYVRADFRLLWLVTGPIGLLRIILAKTFDGHSRMRRRWPPQLSTLDSLEKTNLAELSDDELHDHTDLLLNVLGWWWWEVSLYATITVMVEQIIRKMKSPDLVDAAVLFRGNDSLLIEGERALRHAANTGEIKTYRAKFGHFVESADPIHPTLRESPDLLSQHTAAARRSEITPDERLLRIRSERTKAESHVRSLNGSRGFRARWITKFGQSYAAHTDDAVFHFQRVLALIRAVFLEAGQRLTRMRVLERTDDVFYLEYSELWKSPQSGLTELVTKRRLLRENQRRLAPPSFIPPLSDPAWGRDRLWNLFSSRLDETVLRRGVQERNGRKILMGTPGSPGHAHGIARVITGPEDFHRFQLGDVLVAHTTTPIWTPLFNVASAAVTEVGGPFSHAAIVAREFGIPLVTGAIDATRVISDGAPVEVDGSTGIVEM